MLSWFTFFKKKFSEKCDHFLTPKIDFEFSKCPILVDSSENIGDSLERNNYSMLLNKAPGGCIFQSGYLGEVQFKFKCFFVNVWLLLPYLCTSILEKGTIVLRVGLYLKVGLYSSGYGILGWSAFKTVLLIGCMQSE